MFIFTAIKHRAISRKHSTVVLWQAVSLHQNYFHSHSYTNLYKEPLFRFETTHELCGTKSAPNTPSKNITTRPKRALGDRKNLNQSWMFALLLYDTCVAPMSSYCANSIFEYGMDVAKYNVIANVVKFMMKEVIWRIFGCLRDYALTSVCYFKSRKFGFFYKRNDNLRNRFTSLKNRSIVFSMRLYQLLLTSVKLPNTWWVI